MLRWAAVNHPQSSRIPEAQRNITVINYSAWATQFQVHQTMKYTTVSFRLGFKNNLYIIHFYFIFIHNNNNNNNEDIIVIKQFKGILKMGQKSFKYQ